MKIQILNQLYALLLFVGITNILHASQYNEQQPIHLTIGTTQEVDICSNSQALSRIFFNKIDTVSLQILHDDRFTKNDLMLQCQLLEVQYQNIKPQLSDQAKKYAQSSLESLKNSLEMFE